MPELEILNDLMNNLEAIDVNRSLDNQSLLNAACSMFLNRGQNLLYIYSETKVGWLYFVDNSLVSVYAEEKSDYEALIEIIGWDEVNVKEYRNVDVVEQQFVLNMSEFMELANEQYRPSTISTTISNDMFKDFFEVEGALCVEEGQLVYNENLAEDSLPLSFIESLCGFDTEQKGIFVNIVASQKEFRCYALKDGPELWVLSLYDHSAWSRDSEQWNSDVREVINAS